MRWVLLSIATLSLATIAYYLVSYSDRFSNPARSKPLTITSRVESSDAPPQPFSEEPVATPVASQQLQVKKTAMSPEMVEVQRLSKSIEEGDSRVIDEALAFIVTHPPPKEAGSMIENALMQHFGNRLSEALEPYLHEANTTPAVVRESLRLALLEGSADSLQLVHDKLRSPETTTRDDTLKLLAEFDLGKITRATPEALFQPLLELLQNQEATTPSVMKALMQLRSQMQETEKRQWFAASMALLKQNPSQPQRQEMMQNWERLAGEDEFIKNLSREAMEHETDGSSLRIWLEKLAAPAVNTAPNESEEQP